MTLRPGLLASSLAALLTAAPAIAQSDPTLPPLVGGADAQRGEGTEVHFLSYHGEEQFSVTVGQQTCATPCTLKLRPGPTKIHVVGAGEMELQMVIPHLAAQVRLMTGPPSWYQPAGIVLIPTGIVVAASLWAVALTCGYGPDSGSCVAANVVAWPVLGVTMLVTGAVLLGLYNRSQPGDANRPEILDARRESRWRIKGLGIAPIKNGAAAGLSFSF
jgi:hypothetical protein